jgi:putative DNA primase/helicase
MLTFEQAAAALRAWDYNEREHRARCPAHRGEDRNLSVWADKQGIAGFKCWSLGCSTREIVAALGEAPAPANSGPHPAKSKPADEKANSDRARQIWREAREPRGTIVQDYLFGRGWTGEIPTALCLGADPAELAHAGIGLAIPASIRFHPRLWHRSGIELPAMVAAIEDRDGRIVGVHRTWLKADGTSKAGIEPKKMALGRARGCAVHLTAGAPELVLCEGIETGLSILQAMGLRVWAALGTSNIGQVELPGFVREIIIAADHDEPGMKAASAAAQAYRADGYQVRIVRPRTETADWNDVMRGEAVCL